MQRFLRSAWLGESLFRLGDLELSIRLSLGGGHNLSFDYGPRGWCRAAVKGLRLRTFAMQK